MDNSTQCLQPFTSQLSKMVLVQTTLKVRKVPFWVKVPPISISSEESEDNTPDSCFFVVRIRMKNIVLDIFMWNNRVLYELAMNTNLCKDTAEENERKRNFDGESEAFTLWCVGLDPEILKRAQKQKQSYLHIWADHGPMTFCMQQLKKIMQMWRKTLIDSAEKQQMLDAAFFYQVFLWSFFCFSYRTFHKWWNVRYF